MNKNLNEKKKIYRSTWDMDYYNTYNRGNNLSTNY